jgi:hypothetical protein
VKVAGGIPVALVVGKDDEDIGSGACELFLGGAIYGGAIYGGAIYGGAIYGGAIYGGAIYGGALVW